MVPDTSYDRQAAVIKATFNFPQFREEPACSGALMGSFTDYEPDYSHDDFHFNLDAQSLVIAMAVNLGYLHLEELEFASRLDLRIETPIPGSKRNATYVINGYYDLRYTSMTPILCVQNLTAVPPPYPTELCVLVLAGVQQKYVGLPLLTHGGFNAGSKFYPCDCSDISLSSSTECNEFNFLSGYMVFNHNFTSNGLESELLQVFLHLITAYGSYKEFNDAMAPALLLVEGIITRVETPDQGAALNALSPCAVNYTTSDNPFHASGTFYCSVVMFQSWDHIDHRVSENHFQLPNGSCRDTFTIPTENWFDLFGGFILLG